MLMSVIRPVTTIPVIGLALVPTAPIVSLKGNQAFASSKDVAAFFDKRHDNLLADIDNLVSMGVLDFQETPYIHPQNGQTYRAFDMTKDGFTLLAMGFTGAKALQLAREAGPRREG